MKACATGSALVRASRNDPWRLLELSEPLELLESGKLDGVIDATQPSSSL